LCSASAREWYPSLVDQLTKVVFSIIEMIVALSPIGAFGAMAFTVGRFGLHSLLPLLKLHSRLLRHVWLYSCCSCLCPSRGGSVSASGSFCRYIVDELLLVLATANSEAMLPRLMEKLERMGVPKSVVGLVVPTGYSFQSSGQLHLLHTVRGLYRAGHQHSAAAAASGCDLLVTMLMSKGATGFTGAGFVVLAATLSAMPDIPMAGLALLLGIDAVMQRGRGLTNYSRQRHCSDRHRWVGEEPRHRRTHRRLERGPDADFSAALGVPAAEAARASDAPKAATIGSEGRSG